jgi:phosphoglycolate phosphatase
VLAGEQMMPVSRETVIGMVGNGARVLIESAFAAQGRALTPEGLERLFAEFIAHYAAHIADASRPYPGATAALDRFAANGWRMAVCTNKVEGLARQLLAALDLDRYFAAISGQDTYGFRKPDPRHLTETIRAAGGAVGASVMVGDSHTDIDTARAAGVPVVAVSFGYSPVPVASFAPDRLIASFDELDAAAMALLGTAAVNV